VEEAPRDVFEGDPQSISTIQEWFGYRLTSDTVTTEGTHDDRAAAEREGNDLPRAEGCGDPGNYASMNLMSLAGPV
jgi:hypothetical protein